MACCEVTQLQSSQFGDFRQLKPHSPKVIVSIVSHGHDLMLDRLICKLLSDEERAVDARIVATLNIRLSESHAEYCVRRNAPNLSWAVNDYPKGFGSNHNANLLNADQDALLLVLNPDIRLLPDDVARMAVYFENPNVGLVYPSQKLPTGEVLDFERALATPWQVLKRLFNPRNGKLKHVDWVSGSCMMLRADAFSKLNGFDERYFMYCEDVDMCLRLQLAGYQMTRASCTVIHDTRRATLKNFQHFKWHFGSLFKLWCSKAFWAYLWNRHKIRHQKN